MNALVDLAMAGLGPAAFAGLLATSFAGSFITVSLGIGGGALLLAVMANLMPPVALIPVHGVIQVGSNVTRLGLLFAHVSWPPVRAFGIGSAIGVALGGVVVVELPPAVVQIGVGVFVIWSVLAKPPRRLSGLPMVVGGLSSFLTMFFGATGVFVANFSKSLGLQRQGFVATHAALMTFQHGLKVVAFGLLGFAYSGWALFVVLMIVAGVLGTLLGRMVLIRRSELHFKRVLDIVLVAISLRLIWSAVTSF